MSGTEEFQLNHRGIEGGRDFRELLSILAKGDQFRLIQPSAFFIHGALLP